MTLDGPPDVEVYPALTARELPRREGLVSAIVLHTTGDTDLAKILKFYQSPDGLQPHYVVAVDGSIYHTAHESRVAYHCMIAAVEAAVYAQSFERWSRCVWQDASSQALDLGALQSRYGAWRDEWLIGRGKQSPLELATGRRPNLASVGIELQASDKEPPAGFTDAQYKAAARLVANVAGRRGVPIDREHVLGHADCSPLRRCGAAGPWDPPRAFDWPRFLSLARAAAVPK